MLNLVASFIWGTIGFALFVYGKKADEIFPLVIGLTLMVLSYFLSWPWLTVAAVVLLGIHWMWVRGNS
jgi:hypothetical protein